jgi:hypothetical protein
MGTLVFISMAYLGTKAEGSISVIGGAVLKEVIAKHDATCTQHDCSLYDIKISVPALASSPDVMTNVGFAVTSSGFSTLFNFTYLPVEAAVMKMAHPKEQILRMQAGIMEIRVLLQNYPTSNCQAANTCATEAVGTVVTFGDVEGIVTSISDVDNGALALSLLAPLAIKQAQQVVVEIKSLKSTSVSFDYKYVSYATIQPVEGPVEGGEMVTISSVGLHHPESAVEKSQLQIMFGESAVEASDIVSVQQIFDGSGWPILKVVLRISGAVRAGRVWCSICLIPRCGLMHAVSKFDFTYFLQPSVLKISPGKVTLDGRTDVFTGSTFVKLTVLNFPKIDRIDELQLTIVMVQFVAFVNFPKLQ